MSPRHNPNHNGLLSRVSLITVTTKQNKTPECKFYSLFCHTTHRTIPKVGRPPTPRQFFQPGSQVQDYPAGNLESLSQIVSASELSFVLFYAPWDAASQSARQPFDDVAQFYRREAHFAAINCWQPGGECRQQYSKIKAWPVLMAYPRKNGLGVLYNGPWERDPIMRFVESFFAPLKRLDDPDDLLQAMTGHDAIVVAFLDLQQDTRQWNIYYETAVKWMYRDPFQVGCGILTFIENKIIYFQRQTLI